VVSDTEEEHDKEKGEGKGEKTRKKVLPIPSSPLLKLNQN
jgi:hypothetical protein